jgi:acetolactate synthase-1/2/3 large subunit
MAHGAHLVTGRPQAVMVHVSVGTANAVCGLMNAARDRIPILLTAGRSPILEADALGARDLRIHWGQEMFDQAGMVRELVKWDYELRDARQLDDVVDRAVGIAMTEPKGPIYLTLPREVLASPAVSAAAQPSSVPSQPAPDGTAVGKVADRFARRYAAGDRGYGEWCGSRHCGVVGCAV